MRAHDRDRRRSKHKSTQTHKDAFQAFMSHLEGKQAQKNFNNAKQALEKKARRQRGK